MIYEMGASALDISGGQGMTALYSQLEAAGCHTADDPIACFQAAVAKGKVQDPSNPLAALENAVQACKNGGVASCTFLMQEGAKSGAPCFDEQIQPWHENMSCDCSSSTCSEINPLTNEQRAKQQTGMALPWMWIGGAAAAIGLVWLARR